MIQRPQHPSDRPDPEESAQLADPLSDVLRAVRLRGAVFFLVDASPPWFAEAPAARELAPTVLPGAQHLIEYHVVKRGTCYGSLIGGTPIKLAEGDVLVFPQGDPHVMSSSPEIPDRRTAHQPGDLDALLGRSNAPPLEIKLGGSGRQVAEVVCGFLGCDARPFNPLIANLPRVLHVRADSDPESAQLSSLIALTLAEAGERRAGGESVLARLSELMFIEVVRRHLRKLPADQQGWLAGLRDPVVGRALSLLHARPAFGWTLENLARAASLSRSALAERFKEFVGQPPMQYLANWRMQIAAGRLAGGNANVAAVAYEVGYGSEAAFSRAFKKLVGVPPAAWREQQVAGSS